MGPETETLEKGVQSAKTCPRCGLVNTPSAQRCDCGYDFLSNTIEKSYYKQRFPKNVKVYFGVLVPLGIFGAIAALLSQDWPLFIIIMVWGFAVGMLYPKLLQKNNKARIALGVITFPWGLILLLSREVKLFMLQKGE